MKSTTEHLTPTVPTRMEFVNITGEVDGRRPTRILVEVVEE
jgi:hypothetical protein